jgi:hypothetical protein
MAPTHASTRPTSLLPWSNPDILRGRLSPTRDGSRLVYASTTLSAAAPRWSWAAVYYAPILHSGRGWRPALAHRLCISLSKVLTQRDDGLAARGENGADTDR